MHISRHCVSWIGMLVCLSLIAACSPIAGTQTPTQTLGPTDTIPPTKTPTLTPTLSPTETPDLISISATELMADKLNPFVVEAPLVGTVSLAGENVELNHPKLKAKITFAFDKSIMERDQEETGFPPYSHAAINPEYLKKMGTDKAGAKRGDYHSHYVYQLYGLAKR